MLKLVHKTENKILFQEKFEKNIKKFLKNIGEHSIGFRGGNINLPIYSVGKGGVWAAFGGPMEDVAIQRYWNAFGVYEPNQSGQSISVEINIPIDSNDRKVAGFFAEDTETGDIFLMHTGKVGGGRPGISKSAFLVWSRAKLVEVEEENSGIRTGITVCKLDDPDMLGRLRAFVLNVQNFKDFVAKGAHESPEFKQQVEEFDRYSKEFSGEKQGVRSNVLKYVTYHGEIVQKLYNERSAILSQEEKVFNSVHVDLFVKKNGVLSEVYEVKTGGGRQMLYTAIGQVVTHAASGNADVIKFLVVPDDEIIPEDIERAIQLLGIRIRRFQIQIIGQDNFIKLI